MDEQDEHRLFIEAMRDVTPLGKPDRVVHRSKPKQRANPEAIARASYFQQADEIPYEPKHFVTGDTEIAFSKIHLHRKQARQIRQGSLPLSGSIDLHHHTSTSAISTLTEFIRQRQRDSQAWILVIHGKGSFSSEQKPVLKSLLAEWLPEQPNVLAAYSAHPKHGGTGALYVLLRKNTLAV